MVLVAAATRAVDQLVQQKVRTLGALNVNDPIERIEPASRKDLCHSTAFSSVILH
jgi:hypothetical protein